MTRCASWRRPEPVVTIHVVRTATVPPERVLAALTDFSDRRFEIFGNLDRDRFKIHQVGAASAEVTEGASLLGGIWERIRYDWSQPGVVRLQSLESNAFTPDSSWLYQLEPDGAGGTRVDLEVRRVPHGVKGRLLVALLRVLGARALGDDLARTLRAIEAALP
jgi:Polyketide cyclase / dehydrase and lipid transport